MADSHISCANKHCMSIEGVTDRTARLATLVMVSVALHKQIAQRHNRVCK